MSKILSVQINILLSTWLQTVFTYCGEKNLEKRNLKVKKLILYGVPYFSKGGRAVLLTTVDKYGHNEGKEK